MVRNERIRICECGLPTRASQWEKVDYGSICPCPKRRFATYFNPRRPIPIIQLLPVNPLLEQDSTQTYIHTQPEIIKPEKPRRRLVPTSRGHILEED